ncbi:uroporphyrinogen-III synthase [Ramlibacter sp. XY19]|uniref:uroporphyrinogen-III synthase n=1 Tax=Ramlibacter paludis TaxID=2908000 RepID=UPI0023DAEFA6|nr:uroporphyrinogen-III synthase [Ramlibacter paludis]MCG2595264.1 uroporphyrinogen-III synthase [Ramlibacter paludis]
MRVVVTRPAREAAQWVAQLRERGHDAIALPLIAITPAPDAQSLADAWDSLDRHGAVMFVSANAVHGFFAAGASWPQDGPRAWAPGPATAEALREAGVPPAQIDAPAPDAAQFDSESLWAEVRGRLAPGSRLLLVRGADAEGRSQGREWLSQQLAAGGVGVDEVAAYARGIPAWSEQDVAQARAAAGDCWLFSSSEAARNLAQLLPGQDWSKARALATHPRIAQAVQALGFGYVQQCRPGLPDVVASIESSR